MPPITNWKPVADGSRLEYRNQKTDARAVFARTPDSHRAKWRGVILVRGYPLISRSFDTKETTSFRDLLRDNPAPELACQSCGSNDLRRGSKPEGRGKKKKWYDCRDCGYEAPSKLVYPAEQ